MRTMTDNLTYYNNEERNGPVYSWREVFREFRKLKTPAGLYDPTHTPLDGGVKTFDIISIRARGKTTQWLLVGMCAYFYYGCETVYIRETEDMLAPINARELFSVINEYEHGRYVKQVSDGLYNTVIVEDRRAYFAWVNDEGKIERKTVTPWLHMLSIDRNYLYKSSLNLPNANLILFDEFISNKYREGEFVQFLDLLSTIIRKRRTPVLIMLANNIDVHSPFFREQEIEKHVKKMKLGDSGIFKTSKGMPIYVEIDKPPKREKHTNIVNRLFFGFSNPKLTAITGESDEWVFDTYPHIQKEQDERLLERRLYIDSEELLRVEFVKKPSVGLVAEIVPAERLHSDSVLLTMKPITDKRQEYAAGYSAMPACLWKLYKKNRVFYADNETGSVFHMYLNMVKITKR